MDYAAGTCSEGEALLIASHLTFCPICRQVVDRLEKLGGALLESIEPSALSSDCLDTIMARLDRDETTPTDRPSASPLALPSPDEAFVVPAPLREYLGCGPGEIAWRPVIRGLEEFTLPVGGSGGRVKLLRIRAGTAMPRHTHKGSEMTLVLAGGFSDRTGQYESGDIAVFDSSVDHQPVADPGEDCVCLTFTDAPLRLTGPVGRWLNRFVRY